MVLVKLLDYPNQIIATNNHTLGIGAALYEHLFQTLSTQNYKSAIAIIPSRNKGSLAFHSKFGFKEVGHLHQAGFKFGQWLDTTYMQKMLDGK